jgi:hypothetical protein
VNPDPGECIPVFDWLFEGRLAVYVVLATVAVLLLVLWQQSRKRYLLIAIASVASLAGIYFLLDHFVETDREQIERKIQEMGAAVRARSVDDIFQHISSRFRRGGQDRESFRHSVDAALRGNLIAEIVVWDIDVPSDFRTNSGETQLARVEFNVKARGGRVGETPPHHCRAQFIRDPDGQWRLQGFDLFNPLVDTNQPIQIPQLP